MSRLINTAASYYPIISSNDETAQWQYDTVEAWNSAAVWGLYIDALWPRSKFVNTKSDVGGVIDTISDAYSLWTRSHRLGGIQELYQIFGQTLDQNSNIVANAVIKVFNNTTNTLVDTQQSDGGGYYTAGTPYGAGRAFLYAEKPGSPDSAGASDNNLP